MAEGSVVGEGQTERYRSELERRIAAVRRSHTPVDIQRLLTAAQDAVAAEMSSDMQLSDDFVRAEAEHRRWQAIHRFVRAVPYRDDLRQARPRQWQGAMSIAREIGDLDLLEWVVGQVDKAHLEASRGKAAASSVGVSEAEPTYLVFLKAVANKKRKARAALQWAQNAKEKGWITCTSGTLGENLIALHSASVHSRDNPDYQGPVDGAYSKE